MRLLQLDALRGAAIIIMVIFNWSFALSFLNIIHSDNNFYYWWLFPRAIAASFITIAGVSLSLSYEKVKNRNKKIICKKYFLRGGKIFLLGLLITAITYFTFLSDTIWFGILHLIGLSIIISSFMLRYNKLNLIAGLGIIIAGFYLEQIFFFQLSMLSWLIPSYFQTFDYFPLLPWLGFMLLGMWIGKAYFVRMKPVENKIVNSTLGFLGRHSLLIYIIHQPLLLLVLYLFGFAMI